MPYEDIVSAISASDDLEEIHRLTNDLQSCVNDYIGGLNKTVADRDAKITELQVKNYELITGTPSGAAATPTPTPGKYDRGCEPVDLSTWE